MRGVAECTNGYGGASPERASDSDSSDEEGAGPGAGEAGAGAGELLVEDGELPARALHALNALRKSRQHYDVLLVAGGEETPAHRAVLAAASPYLLQALEAPGELRRVAGVDAGSLRALVEWAYTGRLRAQAGAPARRLYEAAWRLRAEGARLALAERLVARAAPHDALELRALPDLPPQLRHHLDTFIAAHFEEICLCGALAALPAVSAELLRESSAEDGGEAPRAVADAALVWLRDRAEAEDEAELCARTHLLFVDAGGELRDCGELPAARTDAPELQEYRREAAARRRREAGAGPGAARAREADELGHRERARGAGGDCAVLAARALGPRATQALLAVRGRLLAARVSWRAAGGPVARGGKLGHTQDAPPEPEGERRAELAGGRCAHGAAALGSRLVVCGGYDRARVLRGCEAYSPRSNAWAPLAELRGARARFPAVALGGRLYVLGGSDGHNELDSVDVLEPAGAGEGEGAGRWRAAARLPGARSHAAAAADAERGALFVLGGWAAGRSLKAVHRYDPARDEWAEAPALGTARSQCAAVAWRGELWALGGCDAWRCLASTERLRLAEPGAGWAAGPQLPTARRSMGGCAWRGRLVLAGGSDGAASLRRVDWLPAAGEGEGAAGAGAGEGAWAAGPPLRRARAGLALCELEGALYAAGGFSGREFLACVECLPAPDAEWTSLADPPSPAAPLTPLTPPADGEGDAQKDDQEEAARAQ